MKFETVADVDAWYAHEAERRRLRAQARSLCLDLCAKLQWRRAPAEIERINRVLAKARARLARREREET